MNWHKKFQYIVIDKRAILFQEIVYKNWHSHKIKALKTSTIVPMHLNSFWLIIVYEQKKYDVYCLHYGNECEKGTKMSDIKEKKTNKHKTLPYFQLCWG